MRKRALVTGATRGIGKEIAKKLADDGFDIAINYRNKEKAQQLEEELKKINKDIEIIKVYCDVSEYSQCEKMFDEIKNKWQGLDVLVNNAGIRKDNLILKMTEEDFKDVINVNLCGVFYCMKFATKLMLKNRYGRIISISSVSGIAGNPGQINYSASKAGVIAMTKSLAKEVGRKNITVNSVSPGFIESDMTETLGSELKNNMLNNISVRRFGKTEDIASIVSYLASEESSYINGQNIVVDGGLI